MLLAVSSTGDDSLFPYLGQTGRNFLCFEAITPGRVSICVDAFYKYSSCKKVFSQSGGKPLYLIQTQTLNLKDSQVKPAELAPKGSILLAS